MFNRYDQLNTIALLRATQDTARLLGNKEFIKKTAAGRITRMKTELNEMRRSIVPRLLAEDRSLPTFFPIGCDVSYHYRVRIRDMDDWSSVDAPPDKDGKVMDHDAGKVLVQFDGEKLFVRVDPQDLKIKYIR